MAAIQPDRRIAFEPCNASERPSHGYLDAILSFINQSTLGNEELGKKIDQDYAYHFLPRTLGLVYNVIDPRARLLIDKKVAILIYFSTIACFSTQVPPYAWTYTRRLTKRKKESRDINVEGGGGESIRVYTNGYPCFYPENNPDRTWGSKYEAHGTEGKVVWAMAGQTVAHILGEIRRELRAEQGVQFPPVVTEMLQETAEGDALEATSKRLHMMHTCHDKQCLRLSCLRWGTASINTKQTWLRKRGEDAARRARMASVREARNEGEAPSP
jgi:hypothetical protein